jgi:hypothetical protein
VIECCPTAKLEVANVATPEPLSVTVPSVVEPSLKAAVPVGVPVPGFPATVAVNVTLAFRVDGFNIEASVVVVLIVAPSITVTLLLLSFAT